jgi:nucleotide-binding universal stress UspA family protein
MSYKAQRKDIRDTLDPHLAVDPEDRPYLTMDLTNEGDDFPRELRRSEKARPANSTRRYSYEGRLGKALDPHLAVDPEDRPYLLDAYDEEEAGEASAGTREGRRRRAERKTRESYRRRTEEEGDYKERDFGKTDIICIDGSAGADRAMLYAARNLPKDHTLLLVHGVHSWMGKSISERDKPDILELEDHYESLCKRAGRDCKFKHFSYTSTSGFGDEVCRIADKKGAASVVIGRRENVSGMRRTLMGSSSQSVMNNCYVPVTIVGTAISTTKTKQY